MEVVYGSCLFKKSLVGSSFFLRACSNYISVKLKLFFYGTVKIDDSDAVHLSGGYDGCY